MSGTTRVGMGTYAPVVAVGAGNPEAAKYGEMWKHDEYRAVAPGEQLAAAFLAVARPKPGAEVLDLGCGTGRGALALAFLGGLRVTMVDFVRNSLDPELADCLVTQAHALRFVKADLERPLPVAAEYGYCTDVMEHIPPDRVDAVLNNVLRAARHVFFSISTVEDSCGALIGEPLHLTVRPFAWWMAKLTERDCVVHWAQDAPGAARFYVTAWQEGAALVARGALNVSEETVRANVRANVARGFAQVTPHWIQEGVEVMILGGGPSAALFEDEIRARRAAGVRLVTLNGAYAWALERGLGPVTQVMVDARPFNARFVESVDPRNLYLISSQCDPAVLNALPRERTLLWHTSGDLIADLLSDAYPEGWSSIQGGATVLLRAFHLLMVLGFHRFHLYGCDSCLSADAHHAYAQPENDGAAVINVEVGGRTFQCHPWMASQAVEFIETVKHLPEEVEMQIHGDGLLSHIINTGAALCIEPAEA